MGSFEKLAKETGRADPQIGMAHSAFRALERPTYARDKLHGTCPLGVLQTFT